MGDEGRARDVRALRLYREVSLMTNKGLLKKVVADELGELQVNWGVTVVLAVAFIGTGIALVAGAFGGHEGAYVTRPLGISFIAFPIILVVGALAIMGVQKGRRERMERKGIPATARLISIKTTGSRFGVGSFGVKMVFEVMPPDEQPYQVKKRTFLGVAEMSAFQPGAVFPIIIDPGNKNKFMFDNRPQETSVSVPLTFQTNGPGGGQPAPGTQFLQGQQAVQLLQSLGLGGLAGGASNISVNLNTDASVAHLQKTGEAGGLAGDSQVQMAVSSGGYDHVKIQKIIDQCDYEVLTHGETAEATILEVKELGINVAGNSPAVEMLVEVRPEGHEPFNAEVSGFVSEASRHKLQVGRKLMVKFDPADTTKVAVYHTGPDEDQYSRPGSG